MPALLTIVLAGGEGTRMKSATPKLLHKVAGRPILLHVLEAAREAGSDDIAVVLPPNRDALQKAVRDVAPAAQLFEQTEPLGTAHAARMAAPAFANATGHIAIVYADHPLLRGENFRLVLDKLDAGADAAILGFEPDEPTGYGRFITDGPKLLDIVEEKDATEDQRRIALCNACILSFRAEVFRELIGKVQNDNAQAEYYLTDLVALANDAGFEVAYAIAPEADVAGVNSRKHLARAERLYQDRLREAAMADGVTLTDPETVYFAYDTQWARDVTIEPNVVFGPGVQIGQGATIRAFSHIEGAHIGPGTQVGPFARLRPGADLAEGAKVGNFCEVKNASVGEGAKVNHLSYIGDAAIGANANIGAGTITCNYDGVNKSRTVIGENVFVGSNSALVAPVSLGDGAYIATGSVITRDVAPDALAIARTRQAEKPGYAPKLWARARAIKAEKNKDKS